MEHERKHEIEQVLIEEKAIMSRVRELGAQISNDYKQKNLLMVGVLKGGFVFLADLVRHVCLDPEIDFISVSSYGNATETSGVVRIIKDIERDMTDKHVLLVEDLIDTGLTLLHLQRLLQTRNPASVKICAMFDKPGRRKADITVDYIGLEVPDQFIVGYGLDFAEGFRNLRDVCVLKPMAYEQTEKPE